MSLKHTDETKAKISEARKAYIAANPDKVPYKMNHKSKGPSYPERYFTEVLDNLQLVYERESKLRRYSIDFAFIEQRIALEIDGEQHYHDDRIVQHDMKRNQFMCENGWTVLRLRWALYQKLDEQTRKDVVQQMYDFISSKITPTHLVFSTFDKTSESFMVPNNSNPDLMIESHLSYTS